MNEENLECLEGPHLDFCKEEEPVLHGASINQNLVDSKVFKTEYHIFEPCLTVCCITLDNGFMVIGESACASPANFDKTLGEEIAFASAKNKIWELEGYLLKEKMSQS